MTLACYGALEIVGVIIIIIILKAQYNIHSVTGIKRFFHSKSRLQMMKEIFNMNGWIWIAAVSEYLP